MFKSIQQFCEEGTKKLSDIFLEYDNDLTKVAEMVYGVSGVVIGLGCNIIAEQWETIDELLCKDRNLRREWVIERKQDERTVLTSLGEVTFKRTYFKNKKTGDYRYLVDEMIGLEKQERMSEDAKARVLDEAVETSYQKGGENASLSGVGISKEAVMDLIHPLEFPLAEVTETKKKAEVLYIDADEDHVSLQYLNQKGDIPNPRQNTYMPKIVYVYDGVEAEGERHKLTGVRYFGGGYDGTEGVRRLWKEVYDYIRDSYDEKSLEKIYVNGDGAAWIQTGAEMHAKAVFVLDRFHMSEYIVGATAHLKDSAQDARSEIYRCINGRYKTQLEQVFDHIRDITESETKARFVETAKNFILGNWKGITAMVIGKKHYKELGCRAEGHVSHVYADRMSSRPLGWCRRGADRMSRLRIYKYNHGSMLELIRFQKQKQELPKAAGAEGIDCYSVHQALKDAERFEQRKFDVYDTRIYSVPYEQVKKKMAIVYHVWDL